MPDIQELRDQLDSTTDCMERMELMDKIKDTEIQLGIKIPPKPEDTYFECVGCGSWYEEKHTQGAIP